MKEELDFLDAGLPEEDSAMEEKEDFLDAEMGEEESESKSDLAGFSDEELLAELESRGLGDEEESEESEGSEESDEDVEDDEDDDDMADIPQMI